jgi:adenylate kinase
MECEIMQVVLDEARESYAPEIVVELSSDTVDEMESNVDRVKMWLDAWKSQHGFEQ